MATVAAMRRLGGVHVFVSSDRDSAAYLAGDLYNLGVESMFFPTAYKRSIRFGEQDPSGVVQRTAALNALRAFEGAGAAANQSGAKTLKNASPNGAKTLKNASPNGGFLAICTYPEALTEKVASREDMAAKTMTLTVGESVSMSTVEDILVDWGFVRVDFVFEPGQYSIRGGIFDIFSYSAPKPYRVDFFGDEIDSIRVFEISSQLSAEKVGRVEVIPNLKNERRSTSSFAAYIGDGKGDGNGGATWWVDDLGFALGKIDALRKKVLEELDEPATIGEVVTSAKEFLADTAAAGMFVRSGSGSGSAKRPAGQTIEFHTSPQPEFNKQFDMLADDIVRGAAQGYETYILSENRAQVERLTNIFSSTRTEAPLKSLRSLPLTLHEGFVDHDLKLNLYTDHQIFDRYHRYKIRGEIARDESLTVAELNELKTGDFVVHIDHGVGRFGGLVKTMENGRETDAIKLVYKDNDVLLVNVQNLHRIARYKSGDVAEPPKIYKLGSGAWQRMKTATKNAVKSIARELIALYAKRKAGGGFAFSADTYLQQELEASFRYEDTPDQQMATEMIKTDMESPRPMDRLVCGDVGFGKTEVAIRAAFKAVADSKQVAVLVPTTILSLQHYRTFSERLRGFPVRIEFLNRSKSAAETRDILADVASGKVDILIGTHKILGKTVQFKDLGLLIIDEEQKFGVGSKEKLRELSTSVDTLTLTATPIPRTLQFSLMGSRDLSVINTPPPNRQPIVTESHVFNEELIKEAIETELARGGQVYFVHNRVQDIGRIAAKIEGLVPKARVAVMHGQMDPKQVEKLIMDFIYGEFDVLVATSIIENGIDIPNANTIIIDRAHNFGLSDLHQLRGRVGRSNKKGYCYLLSPPDELLSGDSRRRLRAIEEFSDLGSGFNIAMQDLDIRGAGNLFGAEQSGFIADIGFETYRKILDEAVAELRAEGVAGAENLAGGTPTNTGGTGSTGSGTGAAGSGTAGGGAADAGGSGGGAIAGAEIRYIDDSHIETDLEASIPDEYVSNSAEKLKLYRTLDGITDEPSMQRFAAELTDRFGAIPPETETLMNVVRLRRLAIVLGFERVKVKNGLAIVAFPSDGASAYYKSDRFNAILQFVAADGDRFVLRQNNNKLGLTIRRVADMPAAIEMLTQMTKL
ncbi:MAG: transcription-repair coupling factor [Alistipes sp.]|jgi:transcription-repair coupling factor (superfamily II helicase)|nr:transcription-repair coupling factor [Alistipes sp.]